jgi:protein ImuB
MHQPAGKEVHFARGGLMHPTPVLLHARDPRRGQIVVAVSDAARQCGIRPGMPLAQVAGTLRVPSSGNGTQSVPATLPHDPAADLAELARLAEHCERFSPLVGWETTEARGQRSEVRGQNSPTLNFEPGTWNSLFLDVTGIGILFGGEDRLAEEVVADMARLGYIARVAIAGTIGAAWARASWEGEAPAEPLRDAGVQLRARSEEANVGPAPSTQYSVLSTSLAPSPQPLAPAAEFRAPSSALRALPLAALRLPPETLDLFAQLGLKQIADLLALPRASLRARFGERVLLRLDQLTGVAEETIVAYRPPPKFAAEWVLEYPAERREIIDQIVRELVGRVALALAQRREGVVRLHCRLDCAPGQPMYIEVGLFRPSADARHLWDLVQMQLDQLRLPGPTGRITLEALTTAPLENRQAELFAGGKDEADRQLALLIDRLASRLGPDAVLQPQLTSDPLPERASHLRRVHERSEMHRSKFKVQSSKFKVRKKFAASTLNFEPGTLNVCFRPLFLRQPLPLDAVSVVPDGPPITFRFQGRLHRVAAHWGPERIETGWFRGASVRRDYYRVQTDEGLRFWLFRQLGDSQWHLHGEFS